MNNQLSITKLLKPKSISILTAIKVGSQVAGMFQAANSLLSKDRNEEYLESISHGINDIKETLAVVLAELDKLPLEFRKIVIEEVNNALLNDKYIELDSISIRHFIDQKANNANLDESTCRRLDHILLFICNCENRLSYMTEFVRACEIAMLVSDSQYRDYIKHMVERKLGLIQLLFNDIHSNVLSQVHALLALLDDNTYIINYSFDETTYSIDTLTYTTQPHRATTRTVTETKPECHFVYESEIGEGEIGHHGNLNPPPKRICTGKKVVTRTEDIPEAIVFNRNRHAHIQQIEVLKKPLNETLSKLSDVAAVMAYLRKYDLHISV